MACATAVALSVVNEMEFKGDSTMETTLSLAVLLVWVTAVSLVIIIMFLYPRWNIRKGTKAEELILDSQMDDGTTS